MPRVPSFVQWPSAFGYHSWLCLQISLYLALSELGTHTHWMRPGMPQAMIQAPKGLPKCPWTQPQGQAIWDSDDLQWVLSFYICQGLDYDPGQWDTLTSWTGIRTSLLVALLIHRMNYHFVWKTVKLYIFWSPLLVKSYAFWSPFHQHGNWCKSNMNIQKAD